MSEASPRPVGFFVVYAAITAAVSIFFAMLMTEPGQSLDLPRAWVLGYYDKRWLFIALNVALLAGLWYLHFKYRIWGRLGMWLATVGVILCIIAANFLLSAFFPSYQYDANYVSVADADNILDDDAVIYAVEFNGDARGFPREHLEIAHIVGDNIGGEDVVMTFSALSNLPVVYDQEIVAGQASDLRILIQVHNNLVMVDRGSGEIIQQITGRLESSGQKLPTYPNDMMTWATFKRLHPEGTVFAYDFNPALDALLLGLFEGPVEQQLSSEDGPLFPTLDLRDDRLPNKEQVWAVAAGHQQAAFTQSFLEDNPVFAFELGGESLVITRDAETGIVSVFDRSVDGASIEVGEIDRLGNTPDGRLRKLPIHNGVLWMVWAHWFPQTEVYS